MGLTHRLSFGFDFYRSKVSVFTLKPYLHLLNVYAFKITEDIKVLLYNLMSVSRNQVYHNTLNIYKVLWEPNVSSFLVFNCVNLRNHSTDLLLSQTSDTFSYKPSGFQLDLDCFAS